ncbi:MAG TPA: D-2-hydroxyacid dehydrogenase [Burkholderiales bacterium]|nr:D-2-hydroxyacid dehydrogenase [Burkholderiales bacterium]
MRISMGTVSSLRAALITGIVLSAPLSLTAIPAAAQSTQAQELIQKFGLREARQPVRNMPNWKVPGKVVVWQNQDRLPALRAAYPSITFDSVPDAASLPMALKGADVFIGYCIPAGVNSDHQLRWMMSLAVGVENCATSESLKRQKTLITNVKKLSGPEIAEHAIALMMALNRGLDGFIANQQRQVWDRSLLADQIWELEGRTVLVVGLGGIGREVASRAHGLGMNVIATRNSRREGPDYVRYVGLADELLELTRQADVVINTAPLTDKTNGMFNAEFFKAMQPHAYFISIGRGLSTNTDDLVAALRNGELGGAGLDVFDPEPLPADHPLWKQPRVIITPHMAFRSDKLRERVWTLVEESMRRYIDGDRMLNVVDLERGY